MRADLSFLMARHPVWYARHSHSPRSGISTGWPALDAHLVWRGWPEQGLIEVASEPGHGEVSLFVPAFRRLESGSPGISLWVTPPFRPFSPALQQAGLDLARQWVLPEARSADALWVVEQGLRSGLCTLILAWLPGLDGTGLRRLQLAAEQGHALTILFRPEQHLAQPSPAQLRLIVRRREGRLRIQVTRQRGGLPFEVTLEENHATR
ncbi:translesion DNA synthesis-associated protein ImuA [Hahella sp. SMD15-11]|uniref:Translesion DNA synthesis-associated protein ImuA n=1 Tax=Thermohahella caldifontis TaxID=3142973 RepID=A0AB39UYQ3_9GAMM